MKQISEFIVCDYDTTICVPDGARGVGVAYSPTMNNIIVCFECESNNPPISRKFIKIMSWQEVPYNSRYCGSVNIFDRVEFGNQIASLWHVYELQ